MQLALQLTLVLAVLTTGHAVSPVEKVVQMMEDLQTQVITEGKGEAATYDKFACFCKDTTNAKTTAITEEQDTISTLTASINQLTSDRADEDDSISDYNTLIKRRTEQMSALTTRRAQNHATYLSEREEIQTAINDVDSGIVFFKGQRDGAADQALLGLKTVKKAVLLAEAMGHSVKHKEVLAALLQQTPEVPMASSTFASGDIIETMEGLKADFLDKQKELKVDEVASIANYHRLTQRKTMEKDAAEDGLAKSTHLRTQKIQQIGQDSEDLTATTAQLMDDQAYLKDLTDKCNLKSAEYQQRSSMRQSELTALTSALTVVKERVTGATTSKTVRLFQQHAGSEVHATPMETISDEADDIASADDAALSLLQTSSRRDQLSFLARGAPSVGDSETKRDRVVALLRSRGAQLQSAVLASLASRVAADPFTKIKKLIQELIERLLQEAADEANHKGWCDKELGKAKQSRKLKADAVASLNSRLAESESRRDTLKQQRRTLGSQITELRSSLSKMTRDRRDESEENASTVSEAEEGKAAIEEAMDILNQFYKTAAKAEDPALSFVQIGAHRGVDDDLPDAGFGGAYKAGQSASTGIIGMMEVIHSDFIRTVAVTEKQEKSAAQEFYEFQTATKISEAKKSEMKEHTSAEIAQLISDIDTDNDSMADEQTLLDKSIQEIGELIPACIDTGMSYADRVAKREQEIESLKEALCTLDKDGPVQTEAC